MCATHPAHVRFIARERHGGVQPVREAIAGPTGPVRRGGEGRARQGPGVRRLERRRPADARRPVRRPDADDGLAVPGGAGGAGGGAAAGRPGRDPPDAADQHRPPRTGWAERRGRRGGTPVHRECRPCRTASCGPASALGRRRRGARRAARGTAREPPRRPGHRPDRHSRRPAPAGAALAAPCPPGRHPGHRTGAPLGAPDAPADGAPEGAPLGMPEGAPLGAPWAAPDCCRHDDCPPELPLFEVDDESPDPQAARASGDSASRATAGRRRARFMRNSSMEDEEVLGPELNQRRLGLP